jgi:hypothetical protein
MSIEAAARQAIDALNRLWHDFGMSLAGMPVRNADESLSEASLAIAALDAALSQQAAPAEPVASWLPLKSPECWCRACDLASNPIATRMSVCPRCGDKRCTRAAHHDNACSTRFASDTTPPAPSAPLDDPRLQGLFSAAISGALAFGAQNTNPPPAGHWLERFWQMGRAERELSEAAPPAAEPPSTPEMAAMWQKLGSPLTGDEFQRHVTAILLRFAPPPAAEPVAWIDPEDMKGALQDDGWCVVHASQCDPGADHCANVPLYTAAPAVPQTEPTP